MLRNLPIRAGTVVLLLLVGLGPSAAAATVGYKVVISRTDRYEPVKDTLNFPVIKLINRSTDVSIVDFVVTLGKTDFNLDVARDERASDGVSHLLIDGDRFQQQDRWEQIRYGFGSFDPGDWFQFETDVDPDSRNRVLDFQKVLMDIGGSDSSDNVGFKVTFSDDTVLSGNLPDPAFLKTRYTYAQSITLPDRPGGTPPPAIPLPPAAASALVLMGGIAIARRVKRRWFV